MSLLDEIVLLPCALPWLRPLRLPAQSDPLEQLSIRLGRNPQVGLQLRAPWILGSTGPARASSAWEQLCKRIKSFGLALQCQASDLEKVPIELVPLRIAGQLVEQPFSASEFESADLIEVTLKSARDDRWGWPPELVRDENLSAWISALRLSGGTSTPIGIGFPIGVDAHSVESIVLAGADFISLHAQHCASDELIVESLIGVRRTLTAVGCVDVPVLLRTAHYQPEHLVKLLALGASMITIDDFLANCWIEQSEQQSGFLTSVQKNIATKAGCPISAKIQELNRTLAQSLGTDEHPTIGGMGLRLRATTRQTAQLTRIPFLGDGL